MCPITLLEGQLLAPSNDALSNDVGAGKSGGATLTGIASPLNPDLALGHLQNIGGGVMPSDKVI